VLVLLVEVAKEAAACSNGLQQMAEEEVEEEGTHCYSWDRADELAVDYHMLMVLSCFEC
jgi:hypothetical protein